ncbi:MAG TPA: cytochrome d ubiquinol oxidase subunit II [Acidimicrobiales bacterium]|nr:cytochrome d ubiquinol oxidase subunit II [Acidimicrobiales bacterium]
MPPFSDLNTTWFALIGLLWTGYFFLEGFDFGVAVVTPFVIRDETDRRLCLNAVGPVWDGNEVWLLVAGGATFAAFPLWYARLFSGFYLALFLVLVALIARGVSFEFRGHDDRPGWRKNWDVVNFVGSLVPAVVWGVAFTDLVHGVPLSPGGHYFGGLPGLLHPIALVGGLASLAVFVQHGSLFLALKTSGDVAARARRAAGYSGVAAVALLGGAVAWVAADSRPAVTGSVTAVLPLVLGIGAVVAVGLATALDLAHRDGWAFLATGTAIVAAMGAVFSRMFPLVLPASNRAANSLTIAASASQHNTLIVMTIVAACFTPFVLAYQAWTYWVFRQRLIRPVAPAGSTAAASN